MKQEYLILWRDNNHASSSSMYIFGSNRDYMIKEHAYEALGRGAAGLVAFDSEETIAEVMDLS